MIQIEDISRQGFTFTSAPTRQFDLLRADSEHRPYLEKWALLPDTVLRCYRFDQLYHRGLATDLLQSLFSSEALRTTLPLADGRGGLTVPFPASIGKVTFEELSSTSVTLDLFDRLVNNDIVREAVGGADDVDDGDGDGDAPSASSTAVQRVVQMMDVYLPCGITVSDQLRGVFMLGDESEFAGTYDDEEKKEFLYHILWRLCAGGALNQWEDNFVPLRDATRTLYKDLICVGRDDEADDEADGGEGAGAGRIKILSHLLQVTEVEGVTLFPRDDQCYPSNGNYCYVVVNPSRKEVLVWYHAFWSTF